jgi:ATP-binding cassette, subfamily G (WHITE), member 2, PDR
MSFVGSGHLGSYDSSLERTGASSTPGMAHRQSYTSIHKDLLTDGKPSMDNKRSLTGEENADEVELARRDDEVQELARAMTRKSIAASSVGENVNPVYASSDSRLNPNSDNFSAKAWAKAVLNIQSQEADKNPMRTAGVAFRDLNVFGFGAATDYQKTVGSIWGSTAGIARKLLNIGQRRIDILRGFEGIVRPGEILVVLGPPGSGCTTFLKTIAGEWHGFNVDKDSYLNYQGMIRCLTRLMQV